MIVESKDSTPKILEIPRRLTSIFPRRFYIVYHLTRHLVFINVDVIECFKLWHTLDQGSCRLVAEACPPHFELFDGYGNRVDDGSARCVIQCLVLPQCTTVFCFELTVYMKTQNFQTEYNFSSSPLKLKMLCLVITKTYCFSRVCEKQHMRKNDTFNFCQNQNTPHKCKNAVIISVSFERFGRRWIKI